MNLPFFASFIVFIVWLTYEIKKSSRLHEKQKQNFWEREAAANATRKKSLDQLPYITIPFDCLPFTLLADEPEIKEIHKTLQILKDSKIVNFTGYTNTELKLQYGAANISVLTEYDQNFTSLVSTLQKWANILYQKQYIAEAKIILEYAISIHSDVSKTYKLLADIYFSEGDFEKIRNLLHTAETLNSAMKNPIVHTLKESYLYND